MTEPITYKDDVHPPIIYFLTLCATIGGFLFGYNTAIINGAAILIKNEFSISDQTTQVIVASTIVSAATFSLFSGVVADAIGRKGTIMVSSVIFTAGGIFMGVAPGVFMIIIGRLTVGAAIGFVSSVVPVYISECAPNSIRGLLITMNQLFITFGIVISAISAGIFQNLSNGWRYMLGLAALPGIAQFGFFMCLPESPRYLMMKGKAKLAEQSLQSIRNKSDVMDELNEMRRSLEEEKRMKGWIIGRRIVTTPHVRKALFIGCMLQLFQQFCGINAVIYYSSTILKGAGFSSKLAIWLTVIPFTINFLATFIGLWAVESLGRKLALAISFLAIAFALVVLSVGFFLSIKNSPGANEANDVYDYGTVCATKKYCHDCVDDELCGYCYELEGKKVVKGACVNASKTELAYSATGRCSKNQKLQNSDPTQTIFTYGFCPTDYAWLAVLGMVLFVLGFAPGAGPMPWTINAEIYPQWSRSVANSLATTTNWICNAILSGSFLTLIKTFTTAGTFLVFCLVCVIAAVFVIVLVPETRNKTLEEIELLFMTDAARKQAIEKRNKLNEELGIHPSDEVHRDDRSGWIEPSFAPGRSGSTSLT